MRIVEAREQRPWQRCCATCGQTLPVEVALPDEPAVQRRGDALRCGASMQGGEVCARKLGHADDHHSRYSMDTAALHRRNRKKPSWAAIEAMG